jgi:hypothetical protein
MNENKKKLRVNFGRTTRGRWEGKSFEEDKKLHREEMECCCWSGKGKEMRDNKKLNLINVYSK